MPGRGCRTRFGVRSRGSLASATCADAYTPLLVAVHGLPPPQDCVSQPCPACHFPLGESLTAGSPEKKVVVTPFLPINAPVPPRPATRPPAACHWLWDHPAVYEFLPISTPV